MTERKVRWGIVSTADIGMKKVTPGDHEIPAFGSGGARPRATSAAPAAALGELGLTSARAYGTYEELFADPEIDAVYNPAAQPPARAAHPRGGARRQARAVRKADRHDRGGSRANCASCRQGRAHRRSLHGAPPPAMAPRPRNRPLGRARPGASGARRVPLFPRRSDQCAQHAPRSAAAAARHRLLLRHCRAATCSRPSRSASSPSSTATRTSSTDRLASVIADFGEGRQLSFVCGTQSSGRQIGRGFRPQGQPRNRHPVQRAAR